MKRSYSTYTLHLILKLGCEQNELEMNIASTELDRKVSATLQLEIICTNSDLSFELGGQLP